MQLGLRKSSFLLSRLTVLQFFNCRFSLAKTSAHRSGFDTAELLCRRILACSSNRCRLKKNSSHTKHRNMNEGGQRDAKVEFEGAVRSVRFDPVLHPDRWSILVLLTLIPHFDDSEHFLGPICSTMLCVCVKRTV